MTRRASAVTAAAVLGTALVVMGQSPPERLAGYDATEVEPGVWRVEADGVRELARPLDQLPPRVGIAAGQDGSVWLLRPSQLIELGADAVPLPKALRPRADGFADGAVGADGTVWWTAKGLHAYDGESWTTVRKQPKDGFIRAVTVEPDGTVLAALWQKGRTALGQVQDGKLRPLGARLRGFGDAVAATPEGVLVSTGTGGDVWRYDGTSWWKTELPDGEIQAVAFGDGGEFWVRLERPLEDTAVTTVLARWDGDSWTIYGDAHGIPQSGSAFTGFGRHVVAPDGSLWFPARDPAGGELTDCDGLASFDTQQVSYYLRGHCVHDLSIAPDGGVWYLASALGEPSEGEVTDASPIEVFHIPAT